MRARDVFNAYRYDGSDSGHYESYFQRANHPTRPLAFWIRYTMLVRRGRKQDAVGELWAVFFDGEASTITAVKEIVPLAACRFSDRTLDAQVGSATIDGTRLEGAAHSGGHRIAWALRYDSPQPPLLLLPERLYGASFPKAKALVGSPLASFHGELAVDGRSVAIDGWVGSQNHNWGSKHTDRYAWGQVAGFDAAPTAFLECATARVKLGPVYTPQMSMLVLRFEGEEYSFNTLLQSLRTKAEYRCFSWSLAAASPKASVEVRFDAEPRHFIGLHYGNPVGGDKICLNSKLAACEVVLRRPGAPPTLLKTRHRAAFEMLTDGGHSEVPLLDVITP